MGCVAGRSSAAMPGGVGLQRNEFQKLGCNAGRSWAAMPGGVIVGELLPPEIWRLRALIKLGRRLKTIIKLYKVNHWISYCETCWHSCIAAFVRLRLSFNA